MVCIFDMGNVVIRDVSVLEKTARLLGIDAGEFFLDYGHYDHVLMDGTLTCDEYYRHIEHVFGIQVKGKPFSDFFNPYFNEPVVNVIKRLKSEGHRIICASNTFEPHWTIIQQKKLDVYFDESYLSHEIGLTKPSAAFFKYILKKENIVPSDAFFTDDLRENIEAAERLGIKTFWYEKGFDDSRLQEVFFGPNRFRH